MHDAIRSFPNQFSWRPVIENAGKLGIYKRFIVLGMGGSNLAPDLLKIRDPFLNVISHRDYGLPKLPPSALKGSLVIASSYSGNTEETLDGLKEARKKKLPVAVLTTGGKLLDIAKRDKLPYVAMPQTGIQPRSALGFAMLGFTALMREPLLGRELRSLALSLKPSDLEKKGKALAGKLSGRVPVIYASAEHGAIAYNWKIKFNETGKVPAFMNVFPELNHNEMTGFDAVPSSQKLSERFHVLVLKGAEHPQVAKRMETTARLYKKRGIPVDFLALSGKGPFNMMFESLLLADWTAYYTGEGYGAETEAVPMVEEFKKLIS
jgi:glucose/mannose-6-phosphate isomerase